MPGPQTQHKGTVYGDDENQKYYFTYFLATADGVRCCLPTMFVWFQGDARCAALSGCVKVRVSVYRES